MFAPREKLHGRLVFKTLSEHWYQLMVLISSGSSRNFRCLSRHTHTHTRTRKLPKICVIMCNIFIYTHTYTHHATYMYNIYIYKHTYIYIHLVTLYVYIYIYLYSHTHTHIYKYIHVICTFHMGVYEFDQYHYNVRTYFPCASESFQVVSNQCPTH